MFKKIFNAQRPNSLGRPAMRATGGHALRILQIAPVGDDLDPIMIGVREQPVAKLYLLHTKEFEKSALEAATSLGVLKLPVKLIGIGDQVLLDTLRRVTEIVREEGQNFDEVVINVSSGDRMLSCAALSAAFVNGVRAIGVDNGTCFNLPVLKFSYTELVSDAKLGILKSLAGMGGEVGSLQELGSHSGIDKSLLSYHLRGGKDSKGLEGLGLVEIDRSHQGRLAIRITPMGQLMLLGL